MKIVINGRFLEQRIQGITRYALNILLFLDNEIDSEDNFELVCSQKTNIQDLNLKKIQIVSYGKKRGILWELFDFKKYVKKTKAICLNLCNVSPLIKTKSVTTIHDIMYRTDYKDYKGLRNKISALWHRFQYATISKNASIIITDSNYCKNALSTYYPKSSSKIEVVYCGWEHVLTWKNNEKWKEKFSYLLGKDYFFSLATLSKNKNGKWIIEVAKRNPELLFVIGGKFYNDNNYKKALPPNVILLGLISDDDACSLIKNCKAFLFPSINEGFGLPPLEALSLGAKVICASREPMQEIYEDTVNYINPFEYDVDLLDVLKQDVSSTKKVLEKCSWKVSAKKIYDILKLCDERDCIR